MKKRKKQRKSNKKKTILNFINNHKIYTIALALACLMMVILGTKATYSALTAKDDVPNDMRISDFRLSIDENFVPNQGYSMGKPYKKEVTFQNKTGMHMFVGGATIYSQAKLRWYIASNGRPPEDDKEGNWFSFLWSDSKKDGTQNMASYEINTTDWIEVDGYYYYKYVLKPGERTTPLLYSVTPDFDFNAFVDEFETQQAWLISDTALEYSTYEESTRFTVVVDAFGASATPGGYKETFFRASPAPPEIVAIYEPQVISEDN